MKAVIKNNVAIISPQGFIDNSNVDAILSPLEIEELIKEKISALFISLREISSFNVPAISALSTLLTRKIDSHHSIAVGFCDYTPSQFSFLRKYTENFSSIYLLASRVHVRTLFGNKESQLQTIHFWHPDAQQRGLLIFTLFQRGLNAIAVKSAQDLPPTDEKTMPSWIDFHLSGSTTHIKNFTQSNIVSYVFTHFLDSEKVEAFDMLEFSHYLRAGFRIFALDFTAVVGINPHALHFLETLCHKTQQKGGQLYILGLNTSKISPSLRNKLIDIGYGFKPSLDELQAHVDTLNLNHSTSGATIRHLSKKTISSVGILLDAIIETMQTMTQKVPQKGSVSVKNSQFDQLKGEYIAASIAFFGEIEGTILLIFEKEIAKNSASLLLGDPSVSDNDVIDSIAELANITMGKAKTSLSTHHITVNATLPLTFSSLDQIVENFNHKEGVFVDFTFGESTFIFFLTH